MNAILAENLTRKYKGKAAVDNLSLEVKEGEVFGFLGPNGAGKSTLVKMLVTLLNPTSGKAFILGKDVQKHPNDVRLLIGAALQETSLDESQTGTELLWTQGRLYGMNGKDIRQRIEELKPLIDIGKDLEKRIKTYSGGMKRRLDLASAIIHQPKVLFLDEPTTGLDPVSRAKVWQEVSRLNKEFGITIFLTTQYLEEADQLADRLAIINQGKLVAQGTPEELKKTVGRDIILAKIKGLKPAAIDEIKKINNVEKVDLKDEELIVATQSGSNVIGEVAIILNKNDTVIESLTLRTTSLDDVFLEVTGNRMNI